MPIFVQQAELDAARQPHYTIPDWILFPGANYVTVRGMHRISESLTILPTYGHTPGHQSLIARSQGRTDIVIAQAAYTAAEFRLFCTRPREGSFPAFDRYIESNATWSPGAYWASLATIEDLTPDRAFFSHDKTAWERGDLEDVPASCRASRL